MLPTKLWIFNPQANGGGEYQIEGYFESSSLASFLAVGDVITDANSNKYEVTGWSGQPASNSDGNVIVAHFITTDVLPAEDTGYNSTVETPGQMNFRAEVQSVGDIFSSTLYSGQDYEYSLQVSWQQPGEANKAVVGDHFIDRTGNSFEITFLDPIDKFDIPIRAREILKEGIAPVLGEAFLYRPSDYSQSYQGMWLNQIAEDNIRNRDVQRVDEFLVPTGPSGGGGGFTGLQGFTGAQGVTGPQGATGIQGETGLQGATGLQGLAGVQGLTGIQGETGSQGVTGASTNYVSEVIYLNSGQISQSYLVLLQAPSTPELTELNITGAPDQIYGVDYEVTADDGGKRLSWAGLGIDGVVEVGDVAGVRYNT